MSLQRVAKYGMQWFGLTVVVLQLSHRHSLILCKRGNGIIYLLACRCSNLLCADNSQLLFPLSVPLRSIRGTHGPGWPEP